MVLPLLPENQFAAGRAVVGRTFRHEADEGAMEQITAFCAYLHNQWSNLNVSVFGDSVRTNNAVESFHSTLLQLIGRQHPDVWSFLQQLIKIEFRKACDLRRIRNGQQLPPRSRIKYVRLNQRICKYNLTRFLFLLFLTGSFIIIVLMFFLICLQ